MYTITNKDRKRAMVGANTPVWKSSDGVVTHFLQTNMKIAVRVQFAYEREKWHEKLYTQKEARKLAENYEKNFR